MTAPADDEDMPTGENLVEAISSAEFITDEPLEETELDDGGLDELDIPLEDPLRDGQGTFPGAFRSDPRRTLTYGTDSSSAAPLAYRTGDAPVVEPESLDGSEDGLADHLPEDLEEDLGPLENMPTRVERGEDLRASFEGVARDTPARLLVIGGNDRGQEFPLLLGDNSIGRGIDNDVVLSDIAVSRKHTLICYEGEQFVVRDLGSGNGTMVNGEKVENHLLLDGDQLELGNSLLRFVCPSAQVPFNEQRTMIGVPERARAGADTAAPQVRTQPAPPVSRAGLLTGRARRILIYGLIAVTACGGFAVGILYVLSLKKQRSRQVEKAEPPQQEVLAREFNEGIKQYNARNWEQAREHLLKVLALAPNQVNIRQYVDTAAAEIRAREALDRSRLLLDQGSYAKARLEAARVNRSSTYASEAETLAQRINDEELSKLLEQAKSLQAAGNTGAALAKIKRAQQIAPTNAAVIDIYERLTAAKAPPRLAPRERHPSRAKVEQVRPVEKPLPSLGGKVKGAIALYRKRQWGPAYQQVKELAATREGQAEQSLRSLAEAIRLVGQNWVRAEQSGSSALGLRYLEAALNHDLKIEKGIHQRAIKEQMVKLARTLAQSALQQGKHADAYAAIRIVQRYDKIDASLQRVIGALEKRAQEMLSQAQTLRGKNLPQARKLWEGVLRLVPPASPIYQKAYTALNSSGSNFSDEDEE